MNKLTFISLLSAAVLSGGIIQAQTCTGYHRKACASPPDAGWLYNSQSKSGIFEKGMSSEIKIVIYKDNDYSMTLCCEKVLGKGDLSFTMKDAKTGELIYDNATDGKSQHIEFTCETTRNVIVTVTAGGSGSGTPAADSKKSGDKKGSDTKKTAPASQKAAAGGKSAKADDGGCVGLLIEQKPSMKEGFK
jgi:hypothetical protein